MSATKTTQLQHKRDTRNTSTSQLQQKKHQCNNSATKITRVWYDCDTNSTIAPRVKKMILITTQVKKYFILFSVHFLFLKRIHNPWFCKIYIKKYAMNENHEKLSTENLNVWIFFLSLAALLKDSQKSNKWCSLKYLFRGAARTPGKIWNGELSSNN